MYLCICKAVSEKQVEDLLMKGRKSLDEISAECGAGTDCGTCRTRLEQKIQNSRAVQAPHLPSAQESKKD
jgi:bacterioferritin-associated ferredoxin